MSSQLSPMHRQTKIQIFLRVLIVSMTQIPLGLSVNSQCLQYFEKNDKIPAARPAVTALCVMRSSPLWLRLHGLTTRALALIGSTVFQSRQYFHNGGEGRLILASTGMSQGAQFEALSGSGQIRLWRIRAHYQGSPSHLLVKIYESGL